MKPLKIIIDGGLDLIFPPRCIHCQLHLQENEKKQHLCPDCMNDIEYISSPLCIRCGAGFASITRTDHLCGSCIQKPPPYQTARSIASYTTVVKYLLQRLKYGADTTVIPAIRAIIEKTDQTVIAKTDLIIPVPLHINRLHKRGLNQSLVLARLFFPGDRDRISLNMLTRSRDTVPQTTLNGDRRRKNLRGAFRVNNSVAIQNRSICLVDDVFTTGTTISECAGTLVDAGAKEVWVLTFTRV